MKYQLEKFQLGLEKLNLVLTEEKINQFLNFYEMLMEKIR